MNSKSDGLLCPKIRATQGAGVMPDGTTRFTLAACGTPVHHFMGCSTFAEAPSPRRACILALERTLRRAGAAEGGGATPRDAMIARGR